MAGTCSGTINVTASCIDTTWTCDPNTGLETSNCGTTRITTPCTLGSQALQMVLWTGSGGTAGIPPDLRYDVNNNGIVDTGDVTLLLNGTPLRTTTLRWAYEPSLGIMYIQQDDMRNILFSSVPDLSAANANATNNPTSGYSYVIGGTWSSPLGHAPPPSSSTIII